MLKYNFATVFMRCLKPLTVDCEVLGIGFGLELKLEFKIVGRIRVFRYLVFVTLFRDVFVALFSFRCFREMVFVTLFLLRCFSYVVLVTLFLPLDGYDDR